MKCNSIVDRNLMDMEPFRQNTDMTTDVHAIGNTVLCNAVQFLLFLYSLKQQKHVSNDKTSENKNQKSNCFVFLATKNYIG